MKYIVQHLEKNLLLFIALLEDMQPEIIHWRKTEDKWSLLEIICHLYDEERDDFRFRVKWLLDKPGVTPPPFNPLDWVEEHDYINQDYNTVFKNFIKEREASIKWLKSLENANWDNSFEHTKLGKLDAKYFLDNWLAHDYLHVRQILKLKFDYLQYKSGNDLHYAGRW